MIDTHAHLDMLSEELFKSTISCLESGNCPEDIPARLEAVITVGCDKEEIYKALSIANRYEKVWCALGFHPYEAEKVTQEDLSELKKLLAEDKVVAVGECGLDYYRNFASKERQWKLFESQLQIAKELDLPVVVHTRDADEDTTAILKNSGVEKGVIHCFTGTEKLLKGALELGFYISLSGIVTYKNANDLRELAKKIPLDRLLVETDSPYLAPVPKRGKKNAPYYVFYTLKFLSEWLNVPLEVLDRITTTNAVKLFEINPF
ncbi:MAG: TatD family deoxyribonuclease [Aquificaceae bacterium]|nr:MAG: TatD family deoxyribonuclease [Aquificaceae bacterium]